MLWTWEVSAGVASDLAGLLLESVSEPGKKLFPLQLKSNLYFPQQSYFKSFIIIFFLSKAKPVWFSDVVRSKGERENTGVLFLLQLQTYLVPKKDFIKKQTNSTVLWVRRRKQQRKKRKRNSMLLKSWAVSGKYSPKLIYWIKSIATTSEHKPLILMVSDDACEAKMQIISFNLCDVRRIQ